jgi:hypothetical protein
MDLLHHKPNTKETIENSQHTIYHAPRTLTLDSVCSTDAFWSATAPYIIAIQETLPRPRYNIR